MEPRSIKALTLDVFGTLVSQDLGDRGFASVLDAQGLPPDVLHPLAEAFEPALREQFKPFIYEDLGDRETFPRIVDLFKDAFSRLAQTYDVPIDPLQASVDLTQALAEVDILPDALEFLDWADSRYPICLVSDADDDMILPALRRNGLFRWPLLTSESYRGYKISLNTPLFTEALRVVETAPEETLHAGDQLSDVYGAKQAGMCAAYLNRHGSPLEGVKADIEVSDLNELRAFLDT